MSRQSLFRDTIFALSSGTLPSGVAVVRLSGPQVRESLQGLVGGAPVPRMASLRRIIDASGEVLDSGLVIFFPAPASFTGEDCAELHLHGGRATVAAVLAELSSLPMLRAAEAGEFTRRAFVNGKIDLTAAEALADLVAAETESQRRLAWENAEGWQRLLYEGWRGRLLRGRAMIEAELDFADEADVPGSVSDAVWPDLAALAQEIVNHIDGFRAAEIVREGFRVVLAGAPNAGKSSLLNALARRDVAIVADVPGTTRDLIEVPLDLGGIKVVVTDTAGLRRTDDPVERIGVERAIAAAARADLVLEMVEPGGPVAPDNFVADAAIVLRVATKSDLMSSDPGGFDHVISTLTGDGLPALVDAIGRRAQAAAKASGVVPSRLRHVELLRTGHYHLVNAIERTTDGLEMRAEELRLAGDALGRIIGAVDVEDLLGVIFSEFCIGK